MKNQTKRLAAHRLGLRYLYSFGETQRRRCFTSGFREPIVLHRSMPIHTKAWLFHCRFWTNIMGFASWSLEYLFKTRYTPRHNTAVERLDLRSDELGSPNVEPALHVINHTQRNGYTESTNYVNFVYSKWVQTVS